MRLIEIRHHNIGIFLDSGIYAVARLDKKQKAIPSSICMADTIQEAREIASEMAL